MPPIDYPTDLNQYAPPFGMTKTTNYAHVNAALAELAARDVENAQACAAVFHGDKPEADFTLPARLEWSFRAPRLDVDITRILRESHEAGSQEVRIYIGPQTFTFVRASVVDAAVNQGFKPSVPCGASAAVFDIQWQGTTAALVPQPGSNRENEWYCVSKPLLGKIRKWMSRALEVRVCGRA